MVIQKLQAYLTANVEAEADPNSLGDEIESESVPDSPVMNDAFVDEPPELDSDSSAEDDGDSEENSEVEVELAGFNNFNQRRVTRSGRQVAAAKHFMFDDWLWIFVIYLFNHGHAYDTNIY